MRNNAGTYSAPTTGRPVQPGTVVASAVENTFIGDISTEMTDSLSRSNKGGMSAVLKLIDGNVATPALQFGSENGSGLYRITGSDIAIAVNTVKRLELTAGGAAITGTFGVSGAVTIPITLTVGSNATVGGTLSVTSNATLASLAVTGTLTAPKFLGLCAIIAVWTANSSGTILSQRGTSTVSAYSHPYPGVFGYSVAGVTSACIAVGRPTDAAHTGYATYYGSGSNIGMNTYNSVGGFEDAPHTIMLLAL